MGTRDADGADTDRNNASNHTPVTTMSHNSQSRGANESTASRMSFMRTPSRYKGTYAVSVTLPLALEEAVIIELDAAAAQELEAAASVELKSIADAAVIVLLCCTIPSDKVQRSELQPRRCSI